MHDNVFPANVEGQYGFYLSLKKVRKRRSWVTEVVLAAFIIHFAMETAALWNSNPLWAQVAKEREVDSC